MCQSNCQSLLHSFSIMLISGLRIIRNSLSYSAKFLKDMENVPYVNAAQIQSVLKYPGLIEVIEHSLRDYSDKDQGDVCQPLRTTLRVTKHNGVFSVMPGFSGKQNALATKILTVYPENSKKGLPSHSAKVLLFNPENGMLRAIMEGEIITEMRTAAASAVATKFLAKKDAKVLAILGSGVQARSHAEALKYVRSFTEIRVWSRTVANAKKFAENIQAKCCDSVEEAVTGADVIVTATFAETPILEGKWIKQGALVNAVGAPRADQRELDDDVMLHSFVVVDSKESAFAEAGDVILSKATVAGEIGDVISGQLKVPIDKTKVFKSLGIAIEDVVSSKLVYDLLVEQGTISPTT